MASQTASFPMCYVGDYSVWEEDVFHYHEAEEDLTEVDDELVAGMGVMKATDVIGDYAYLTAGDACRAAAERRDSLAERKPMLGPDSKRDGHASELSVSRGYSIVPRVRSHRRRAR